MIEADTYGFTEIAMQSERGGQPAAHNLYAEFYLEPVQDEQATLEQGRPIFREAEYVKIMTPGDKNSIIQRPIRIGRHDRCDNMRFPQQYAQFKAGQAQVVEGTPLKEWPLISRAQVKEMEFFGVKTVEQLATMPDSSAQKFMGVMRLKEQAKTYLEQAKGGAPSAKLQAEVDSAKQETEALKQQMAEMVAEMKSLRESSGDTSQTDEPAKGKPGRPRKVME